MMESDEFLGNIPIIFDEKGRFNVPARIKAILESKYNSHLIIYVNEDHITITPKTEWDESKRSWEKLDPFDVDDVKKSGFEGEVIGVKRIDEVFGYVFK